MSCCMYYMDGWMGGWVSSLYVPLSLPDRSVVVLVADAVGGLSSFSFIHTWVGGWVDELYTYVFLLLHTYMGR